MKGIGRAISAELAHVLVLMDRGDDLVVCDVNHPAAAIARHTAYGKLIDMADCTIVEATRAIPTFMPVDTFVDEPVGRI